MNIKKTCVFVMLAMAVFSCDHTYREYDKKSFPSLTWKNQKVVFHPVIDDSGKTYTIEVGIRYHLNVRVDAIKINVKIVSPSGLEKSGDHRLILRNEKGAHTGSCAGDICDLETLVLDDFVFQEKGEYTVTITHSEKDSSIAGVMEVGLIIDQKPQ